jgi:hypothetical protein
LGLNKREQLIIIMISYKRNDKQKMVKLSQFPGTIPSRCVARTEGLGYVDPRPHHYMDVFYYYYYWWGGTKSLGTAATSGLLYKPQMVVEGDCGTIGQLQHLATSILGKEQPAPTGQEAILKAVREDTNAPTMN